MKQAVILGLLLTTAGWAADEVRVTFYDRARLTGEVRDEAFGTVRRVFRQAGIPVRITKGDLNSPEASAFNYDLPLPASSIAEASCGARQDIALEVSGDEPKGLRPAILALSQPWARQGLNVRVFDARVNVMAQRDHLDRGALLGYVIAHEMGHVLLRSKEHATRGMLRSFWSGIDIQRIIAKLLYFDDNEAADMRRNIRGCSASQVK